MDTLGEPREASVLSFKARNQQILMPVVDDYCSSTRSTVVELYCSTPSTIHASRIPGTPVEPGTQPWYQNLVPVAGDERQRQKYEY